MSHLIVIGFVIHDREVSSHKFEIHFSVELSLIQRNICNSKIFVHPGMDMKGH